LERWFPGEIGKKYFAASQLFLARGTLFENSLVMYRNHEKPDFFTFNSSLGVV
jgi:hypothetical protein